MEDMAVEFGEMLKEVRAHPEKMTPLGCLELLSWCELAPVCPADTREDE